MPLLLTTTLLSVGRLLVAGQLVGAGMAPDPTQFDIGVPLFNPQIHTQLPYTSGSGLRLELNVDWANSPGYRPIRCTVRRVTAVQADTLITVKFHSGRDSSRAPAMTVQRQFTLPAGQTSATMRLLVPQYVTWNFVDFDTWVDGRLEPELSLDSPWYIPNQSQGMEAAWIGEDSRANFRSMRRVLRSIQVNMANGSASYTMDQFPSWLDYSCLDLIVTDLAALNREKAEHPTQFREFQKWLRAGGNLWVLGMEDDWQNLAELEDCLDLPNPQVKQERAELTIFERGWRYAVMGRTYSNSVENLLYLQQPFVEPTQPEVEQSEDAQPVFEQPEFGGEFGAEFGGEFGGDFGGEFGRGEFVDPAIGQPEFQQFHETPPVDSRDGFVMKSCDFGLITAFKPLSSQRGGNRDVGWELSQSQVLHRLPSLNRLGNDPGTGNDAFSNFLIPGVGASPVTAFQVLLSLFVLGIGPLNYYILNRRNQLPYLLLTVPTAALATIVVLVGYSYLSDGFRALVRVRSFTLLDQQEGIATSWDRRSYFAGLRPQKMELPANTMIFPIYPSNRSGNMRMVRMMTTEPRTVVWSGGQQLTDGWLASRTPTQYLALASRDSKRGLQFNDGAASEVTNQLGVDVKLLVVQNADDEILLAEELPAGESARLSPSSQIEAMSQLRGLFSENEPQFPPGVLEAYAYDGISSGLPLTQNLLEAQLGAVTSALTKTWGPRTYIAITHQGVDLALGIDGITEDSSFHVVKGRW